MNPSVKPTSTGSSALIKTGNGGVTSATLAAGSDAATLILYDNTAGSGTAFLKLAAAANTTAHANFSFPMGFTTGCYAALTGTGPNATVGTT